MFLPTTKEEMQDLGWEYLDIILVSGDTYIDSSYNGTAVIGKWLLKHNYKVGIIAQPNIEDINDITRLGEPRLYWGVSAGCVDSMVANYTALKKRRHQDDFTPGGLNNRRPDRAVISYTNLIKKAFKNSNVPVVIAGIESSLRRVVHYDYWSNSLRRSILFDSKADILSYGMGEKSMLELATAFSNSFELKKLIELQPYFNTKKNAGLIKKANWKEIEGIGYISKNKNENYIDLPTFEECQNSKKTLIEAFNIFYSNCDSITATGLNQGHGDRYYIQNPPSSPLLEDEMDAIYGMEFERDVHPFYKQHGSVKALETIKNSITTHRGCYGECNFCAIAIHQGRTVTSRTESSILLEANFIAQKKGFDGYIRDVGGPTANMYGIECNKKLTKGSCSEKRCLFPTSCPSLKINHHGQIELLKKMREIQGIKKIFIASGIRYDLILDDKKYGEQYLEELIKHHVSGQMKIAPEHTENKILNLMGKKGKNYLIDFKNKFYEINKKLDKKQFLTYYLIAGHPNCNEKDMKDLKKFASKELKLNPEQVQIFTPTSSTYSTLMYYTELNPFDFEPIFVEKDNSKKQKQKEIIIEKNK